MKKNVMMRVASALLVAVLLSTCAISGTYAKYISTASLSDTARVAKWDIDFNTEDGAVQKTFAFDLFNTVNDTVDGNKETDVMEGVNETIIAPGTKGSFQIKLKNYSEVNAKFNAVISADIALPINFTVENANNNIAMNGGEATITVNWEWPFGDDVVDNEHANKEITVTATVTVEQVD